MPATASRRAADRTRPGARHAPGAARATGTARAASWSPTRGGAEQPVQRRRWRRSHDVPADGDVARRRPPGVGDYRVAAATTTRRRRARQRPAHSATSTRHADQAAVVVEVLLIALGSARRGGRRHACSSAASCARCARWPPPPTTSPGMPLASGEVDLDERVARAPHRRGHRGRPGGPALNTLLDHVETLARGAAPQRAAGAPVRRRRLPRAAHAAVDDPRLRRAVPPYAGRPGALSNAMTKVETETDRMSRLVEDMLLLARLDSGRPLERDEVDLTRLLLEAVADARVVDSRAPVAARPARRAGHGHRRRAAAAPAGHQPARQRPPPHAARHHRHRVGRAPATARRGRGARRRPRPPAGLAGARLRAVHPRRHLPHPVLRRRRPRPLPGRRDRPGPRRHRVGALASPATPRSGSACPSA